VPTPTYYELLQSILLVDLAGNPKTGL